MPKFTDGEGRDWIVVVNVSTIKRVKHLLDVDLLEAIEGTLFERLITRPDLLCDVVYALCKPEADKLGISDEAFGQAMAGDVIDDATNAFLEALVDFFPGRRREILRKALDKIRTFEKLALAKTERVLDSPALDRRLAKELAKMDAPATEPASPPPPGS